MGLGADNRVRKEPVVGPSFLHISRILSSTIKLFKILAAKYQQLRLLSYFENNNRKALKANLILSKPKVNNWNFPKLWKSEIDRKNRCKIQFFQQTTKEDCLDSPKNQKIDFLQQRKVLAIWFSGQRRKGNENFRWHQNKPFFWPSNSIKDNRYLRKINGT